MEDVKLNYVGAVFDWDSEKVLVWERDASGRNCVHYDAPYYFYTPNPDGEFTSMYGEKLEKHEFGCKEEFELAKSRCRNKHESDFSPLDKVLMNNYFGVETPKIHYAFLDIEVDVKMDLGFSSPDNPYAPVNAVTIFKQWSEEYTTIAVPPPKWKGEWKSGDLIDSPSDIGESIKSTLLLVKNEAELLTTLLDLIEDVDVLSGWNSEFFDMPYLVKRTEMVLGPRSAGRWCFRGAKKPKFKEVEKFGVKNLTVSIFGRSHLDYLQLFKKFTFEGRTSFALAAIAEDELDIPKLEFDGTFEELYNDDFEHFIRYNIRDTEILHRLDQKFNFISLANQMAHENTVLLESVLGTVKISEAGITNNAHNALGVIVCDKKPTADHGKVEGAIVLTPKIGLHEWIGSVDINSLYPSTIRALNISPEKIIGQFTAGEEDWKGIMEEDDKSHLLVFENGEEYSKTGKEWNEFLKSASAAISAYGTVFDQANGVGIVPNMLGSWYAERKKMQKLKKEWGNKVDALKKAGASKEEIQEAKQKEAHYDLLQLTKKISLNSVYGALLNEFFRFSDPRMGASVTATGRQITTHMIGTIGNIITGEFANMIKSTEIDEDGKIANSYITESPVILASDTDSCYFLTLATNKDESVVTADAIADEVNNSFPVFMRKAFNCQPDYDDLIKAGREVVAERGLFQAKKKYMLKIVNLDGKDCDKFKAMGSEIKKSDTPRIIQGFLKSVVDLILNGNAYPVLEKYINEQRKELMKEQKNVIALGIAKAVNNLDEKFKEYQEFELTGKRRVNLPGHVRASINYNQLSQQFEGKKAKLIKSGDKILVFYVKPNKYKITSIALPSDFVKFPKWFNQELEVDISLTEQKMIDAKLEGIFSALNEEVPTPQRTFVNSVLEF